MEILGPQDKNPEKLKLEPGNEALKVDQLPLKTFKEQQSLYTEILNSPKCKFLYGLAVGTFLNLLVSTTAENYLKTGE